MGSVTARTEFGLEILRTFDGGRWMWNEDQSWLEFIPYDKVMPRKVEQLHPRDNRLLAAVLVCCQCEGRRVYDLKRLEEAD